MSGKENATLDVAEENAALSSSLAAVSGSSNNSTGNNSSNSNSGGNNLNRHEAMLEKLKQRETKKAEERAALEEVTKAGGNKENTSYFLKTFEASRSSILLELDSADIVAVEYVGKKELFDALKVKVTALQSSVAEASHYLPTYDQKQCSLLLEEMLSKIDASMQAVLPKKKFAFAKKEKKPPAAVAAATSTSGSASPPASCATSSGPSVSPPDAKVAALLNAYVPTPTKGLSNLSNCIIIKCSSSDVTEYMRKGPVVESSGAAARYAVQVVDDVSGLEGQDLWISNVSNCKICIIAPLRAVRVDKVKQCEIILGPVAGSLHIEDVNDSVISVASRQIRIHEAHRTTFNVHVISRPIIEHSDTLEFAPLLPVTSPSSSSSSSSSSISASSTCSASAAFTASLNTDEKWSDLMIKQGLSAKPNLWRDVDDFNWLKMQQSPNWKLKDEADAGRPDGWKSWI